MGDILNFKIGKLLDELPFATIVRKLLDPFHLQIGKMLNNFDLEIGEMLNNFDFAVKGVAVEAASVVIQVGLTSITGRCQPEAEGQHERDDSDPKAKVNELALDHGTDGGSSGLRWLLGLGDELFSHLEGGGVGFRTL